MTECDWKRYYLLMVSEVCDEVWKLMFKSITRRAYLWYREVTPDGKWGKLIAACDQPAGYKLACSEAIPYNITRSALWCWLIERCRYLPIIGSMPCEKEEIYG